MNLEHLRTFVTVVRAGSLSEAARLLGIAQPTVTAHIQSLEAAFGFPLLERTASGAVPTARGNELAREASAHVDALDDIASLATTTVSGAQPLHIGGPAEYLSTIVVPHLAQLVERSGHPIRLTFGLADELLANLANGTLDIVVSATRPNLRGVSAQPLFDEEFVLVASPRFADHDPSDVPVVAYAENLPIVRRYWRSVFDSAPNELRVAAIVPDLRGVRDALIGGAGMSVLPRYLVGAALDAGDLVVLHTPEVEPLNTVFIATRAAKVQPVVTELVEQLKVLTPSVL